jgi:hypothetical protein
MPAVSSSLVSPALVQVEDLPAGDRALLAGQCPSLAEHLAGVPDPRDPRGVRHTLTSLLLAAVAAVLAGAQSFTAIGEWAADAPPQVLAALGVRYDPLARRFQPPDEATIRRVLEAAVGSWLAARLQAGHPPPGAGRGHGRAEWRTLKTAAVAAGIAFPHAAQAIQIRRRRRTLNGSTKWSTQTSYAVTSVGAHQATPAQLAAWIRGHWGIEALHHIRSPGVSSLSYDVAPDPSRRAFCNTSSWVWCSLSLLL